jgi:hypothetical protein
MKQEEITRNIKTERAFRRISSGLVFFAFAVLGLIVLSAYLKFKPQIGEEITDGKFKQFWDNSYTNKALIKLAAATFVVGVLRFLPARAAFVSMFADSALLVYFMHVHSFGIIKTYPNGFLATYCIYFAAALCCASMRYNNARNSGKAPVFPALSALSASVSFGIAYLCIKMENLKTEYADYQKYMRFVEDAEERKFGEYEMIIDRLDANSPGALVSMAIIMMFIGLITLVLFKFPRLSVIAPIVGSYVMLKAVTVGTIYTLRLPLFFMTIMAIAAILSIPTSDGHLLYEPDPEELDENADEDDEDDAEYEEIRAEFEKNGCDLEDYGG